MKTEITILNKFEAAMHVYVDNNDQYSFMHCQILEADGYDMLNNGCVEDGKEYTIYGKIINI